MSNTTSQPSFFQRALREPVVHFTLIAVIFFLVTEFVSSGRREVIEIDRQEVAWRIQQIEKARVASDTRKGLEWLSRHQQEAFLWQAAAPGLDTDAR